MPNKIAVRRTITKRFKLHKNVREIYSHSNLNIFPDGFDYEKVCLLLSKEILKDYSSILFFKKYNFILCECETKFFSEEDKKRFIKMNDKIVFLNEGFFEEILEENIESVFIFLKSKFTIDFIILNPLNFLDFIKTDQLLYDLEFCNEQLKPNPHENFGFQDYHNNLELLHKRGKIDRGILMISQIDRNIGEVVEKDKRKRIFGSNINRGLHGDEVYIENDSVVGIYKRKRIQLVGTLIKILKPGKKYNIGLVRPIDNRFPEVEVFTVKNEDYILKKVEVHILGWDKMQQYPRGVIYNTLGRTGDYECEVQSVLHHCSVEYANLQWDELLPRFNINDFNLNMAYEQLSNGDRIDLRDLEIYSIDPPGCTDIDDAIHCREFNDYYELGVHIADVSYYVEQNTFLDLEAKNRSTTIYFPDRRIDMLPPFISSNLASLIEKQDKVAISVIWKINKNYEIFNTKICKSLINIKRNMTYEEAENKLLVFPFNVLWEIASFFKSERSNNGALDLSVCGLYFDKNNKIARKTSLNCHFLVEEFMLKANISVAEFLLKNNPEYSLLRKHPLPAACELDSIDFTNSKTINESLSKIDVKRQEVVKRVITRSMQQAIYFSSGDDVDYYHFGLAIGLYTHFTSPIRRYPDLIVHRMLSHILKGEFDLVDRMSGSVDKKACSKMNFRHRNAQLASRMVNELCLALVLENVREELEAVVISIIDNGVVIFNSDYGIESFVETSKKFGLFESIKVKVESSFTDYCVQRKFLINIVDC